MAVVPRQRRNGVVFFVATHFKGRCYWERAGTDRREADRLSERRKREVKAGTFQPPALRQARLTVAVHFRHWESTRQTRNAKSGKERYLVELIARNETFGALGLDTVRPRHVIQLTRELQARYAPKTVSNAISLLTTMFRDAEINETISRSPVVLPRGLLSKRYKPTEPYEAGEVARLLALPGIHGAIAAVAFYTGMRPGEIAGRRWRDIDERARPLAALSVHTQFFDEPLKGDGSDKARPRTVPIHPDLARALATWQARWSLEYASPDPTPDDWLFPGKRGARDRSQPYTRSGLLQLWKRACALANVTPREFRATRNTFVTFARRSSPRTDIISDITHSSKGAIIDRYNKFQYGPRCDVMSALTFDARDDEIAPGAPVCGAGLHAICVCADSWRDHCQWLCVRE